MVDATPADGEFGCALPADLEQALVALLAIDAASARRVRGDTPSRRRSRPQRGPHLDLGGGASGSGPH